MKSKKNKIRARVIHSIDEFKKEYLPIHYKEEAKRKEKDNKPGTGLTKEVLESFRQQLAK